MADIEKTRKNLEARGFDVTIVNNAQEAMDYLDSQIDNTTVGVSGSYTLQHFEGFPDRLSHHNAVFWHWFNFVDTHNAIEADAYITSANALAETGELVTLDSRGNRSSSMLFGHNRVYFVMSRNKIMPDYDSAVAYAKNIACPLKAMHTHKDVPCVPKIGGQDVHICSDCDAEQRVCKTMLTHWRRPDFIAKAEVVIILEDLGEDPRDLTQEMLSIAEKTKVTPSTGIPADYEPDMEKTRENLEKHGFKVLIMDTKEQAANYLNEQIDNTTVGISGSVTIQKLVFGDDEEEVPGRAFGDRLAHHNTMFWHWYNFVDTHNAIRAEAYITSANAIAETGQIVNVDSRGNRSSSLLFGHDRLFIVAGKNKIVPTLEDARWRAKNVCAPANARRMNGIRQRNGKPGYPAEMGCVANDHALCNDCNCGQRICKTELIHYRRPDFIKEATVILLKEEMGI